MVETCTYIKSLFLKLFSVKSNTLDLIIRRSQTVVWPHNRNIHPWSYIAVESHAYSYLGLFLRPIALRAYLTHSSLSSPTLP